MTKHARRATRAVRMEAAGTAVAHAPLGKDQCARLSVRLGKKKAIVAIARRLFVAVWPVLTTAQADRHAVPAVGRKLLKWGDTVRTPGRQRLSRNACVRAELSRLGYPEKDRGTAIAPADCVADLSPPAAHPRTSAENSSSPDLRAQGVVLVFLPYALSLEVVEGKRVQCFSCGDPLDISPISDGIFVCPSFSVFCSLIVGFHYRESSVCKRSRARCALCGPQQVTLSMPVFRANFG